MHRVALMIVALIAGGYLYKTYLSPKPAEVLENAPLSFEECTKSQKGKILETYPRQCDYDGKVFIEEITSVPDTSSWETFNSKLGFSIKCPPGWICNELKDSDLTQGVSFYNPNYRISDLLLNVINIQNFQDSPIRHSNYTSPRQWFNALIAKNPESIKIYASTRKVVKGGYGYPIYQHYNLSTMKDFKFKLGNGVLISRVVPSTGGDLSYKDLILPLNNADVILITEYQSDPILDAAITSIEKN